MKNPQARRPLTMESSGSIIILLLVQLLSAQFGLSQVVGE